MLNEAMQNICKLLYVFNSVLGLSLELHDLDNNRGAKLGINEFSSLVNVTSYKVCVHSRSTEWLS